MIGRKKEVDGKGDIVHVYFNYKIQILISVISSLLLLRTPIFATLFLAFAGSDFQFLIDLFVRADL